MKLRENPYRCSEPEQCGGGYSTCLDCVCHVGWSAAVKATLADLVADLDAQADEQERLQHEAFEDDNGWLGDEHMGQAQQLRELAARYRAAMEEVGNG